MFAENLGKETGIAVDDEIIIRCIFFRKGKKKNVS
ncbi:MAG: hypothetical protein Ct9H300mP28_37490 [Pseudomonadota bacterium]|nr:MAG: hypothetical protein Ct9H300mP28_37490 [Pseudomonadota bacterium]